MVDYGRIDTIVRATVMSNFKKIAIVPFAEEGMMAKQILNQRYGIMEDYIIDNRLAEVNPKILSSKDLIEKDLDGLFVLLMISNKEINQTLENQMEHLKKLEGADGLIIQNILKPAKMIIPDKMGYYKDVRRFLVAQKCIGNGKFIRIGKDYAGGYILLDDFNCSMRAYSFGIENDVSFEMDLAKLGLEVFMYDHTINGLPEVHEKFHFQRVGISHVDEMENHKLSLKTILENHGDIGNDNLILKMDVEGAEWEVIMNTPSEIWNQFRQMTFEFHGLTDATNKNILPALEKLNKTHQVVWLHGNNYGYVGKAGDVELPAYLELTYVNKAIYRTVPKACQFPLHIDSPCSPNIEEYILGNWGISE